MPSRSTFILSFLISYEPMNFEFYILLLDVIPRETQRNMKKREKNRFFEYQKHFWKRSHCLEEATVIASILLAIDKKTFMMAFLLNNN